ncbi:DUF2069 domain-containing protein [Psychromonas algicola]|uniref:DUF2069 domain-containing protein n=1 Tax=Psychromonas algicola TaxID=2555642 RepID=UPI0010682EFF|nr:DUF2069 domain-containing protein [Psychromonas sp. RZ5]TEW43374.1 DUF2069 domain-containing protein [Psychromonas sp. RZ5]
MNISRFQRLAQCGYFGLLLLVPLWHLYLSPPTLQISPWLITSIWLIPLLFPLKGIIKGNPYTYAWSGFIALIYIMHACVIIMSDQQERVLGIIELIFASLFLIGNIYFAKYKGQELGLSIRKKKKES